MFDILCKNFLALVFVLLLYLVIGVAIFMLYDYIQHRFPGSYHFILWGGFFVFVVVARSIKDYIDQRR